MSGKKRKASSGDTSPPQKETKGDAGALAAALAADQTDWRAKIEAAEGLGRLGAGGAALLAALEITEEEDFERPPCNFSGGEPDAKTQRATQRALVRRAAAQALGKLNAAAAPHVAAAVAAAEREWNHETQMAIQDMVKDLGAAAVPPLVAAIETAPIEALVTVEDRAADVMARRRNIEALGWVGPAAAAGAAGALAAALGRPAKEEARVRQAAACALGRIGPTAGAPAAAALAKALRGDASDTVRYFAVGALANLGPEAVARHVGDIAALAEDAEAPGAVGRARVRAVGALEALGAAAAAPHLALFARLAAKTGDVPDVRAAAARALGTLGAADHSAALGKLEADTKAPGEVREAARWSLAQFSTAQMIAAVANDDGAGTGGGAAQGLAAVMADGGKNVHERMVAIEALQQLGPAAAPHAAKGLMAVLHDDSVGWGIRMAAADALGAVGKDMPAVVSSLEGIMEMGDEVDEDVQNASGRALEALGCSWW